MVPPLLNILRLVLGPALVFSFINAYVSNYGRNTRTTKTCRARTSCRILLHGYLCVYSSYGFIICVLVGNANGTLGSTFFTNGAADAIGMCLIAVNPLRVAASRAWSFEFAMKICDARIRCDSIVRIRCDLPRNRDKSSP